MVVLWWKWWRWQWQWQHSCCSHPWEGVLLLAYILGMSTLLSLPPLVSLANRVLTPSMPLTFSSLTTNILYSSKPFSRLYSNWEPWLWAQVDVGWNLLPYFLISSSLSFLVYKLRMVTTEILLAQSGETVWVRHWDSENKHSNMVTWCIIFHLILAELFRGYSMATSFFPAFPTNWDIR